MRQVTWEDKHGYKRVSLVRDTDPDEAAELGIPVGPPNLDFMDWEEVKIEINNVLVQRGCLTWPDVQRNPNAITMAVRAAIVGRIVNLYKLAEVTDD